MDVMPDYDDVVWLNKMLREANTHHEIRWILRNILVTYKHYAEKNPLSLDGVVWASAVEFIKRGYHVEAKYPFLGRGSRRFAIRTGPRTVLKIPVGPAGVLDNRAEHARYRYHLATNSYWVDKFAPCRLHPNDWLSMVYVQELSDEDVFKSPEWVYSIDDQQVGYGPSGRLLAYDYASN